MTKENLTGLDGQSPTLPSDDVVLERMLDARFSCRGFTSESVGLDTIQRMMRLAQKTASWCNSQPWQVTVLSGGATAGLAEVLLAAASTTPMKSDVPEPEEYRGVYMERRRAVGRKLYESVGIARDDEAARENQMLENFRFFGAPHVAVITSEAALGPYGLVDCGGYVSTLLLAAQSLGIDTIAQAAIAMYSDAVREYLQLPPDRVVVCAVSFGYADRFHPANGFRAERAPQSEVVTYVD